MKLLKFHSFYKQTVEVFSSTGTRVLESILNAPRVRPTTKSKKIRIPRIESHEFSDVCV